MPVRTIQSFCFAVVLLIAQASAHGDLIIDSSLSTTTFTVLGVSDSSATSGTLDVLVSPGTSPFNTAQIIGLDALLDDEIDLDLLGGAVSIGAAPASINVQLASPGPAGAVVGGSFDQIGNELLASGLISVNDPFNLAGGSTTVDLSTLGNQTADFNDVLISESGDIVTVDLSYSITGLVGGVEVVIDGRIVASGDAISVPEPSSVAILFGIACISIQRRGRRTR